MRHAMSKVTAVCVLVAALGAAACGQPDPYESVPGLAALVERSDSAGVAKLAFEKCGQVFAKESECYNAVLMPMVEHEQVRLAMNSLNLLSQLDPGVLSAGHEYAHHIGMAAFKPGLDVAKTFSSCTESFASGCYHGVIQSYLTAGGNVDAAKINALCGSFTTDEFLRFQCLHGTGHGLTMLYEHELPKALDGCDLLDGGSWAQESCYGGAFMENVVQTSPHHGGGQPAPEPGMKPAAHEHGGAAPAVAAADAPADEHAGHAEAMPAVAAKWKPRDPADPLYPCSIVGDKYRRACYVVQTPIIFDATSRDYGKSAAICAGAPEKMQRHCYMGLGNHAATDARYNPDEAIRLCSLGSADYARWCFVGVVKNLVDLSAKTDNGFAFCRKLPGGAANKSLCYEGLGEMIGSLEHDLAHRETLCRQAESEYVEACRFGARVRRDVPPELARNRISDA
jgi:hypothetical protein